MPRSTAAGFVAALAAMLGLSGIAGAQPVSATLQGTVVDQSAAVVPDVSVTLANLETSLQRTAATGADGTFVVSLLPPGRYHLTARRAGFIPTEIPELVLNVGDAIGLKVRLKVAGLDTSVTVTAETPRVNTSSSVSTVIDRQLVENIPLNGRSFQPLISLSPGVVVTPATSTSPGQFSVNGQRSDANYFMVDGVSANLGVGSGTALGVLGAGAAPGLSAQGGTNSIVAADALQEFRIETSTYAPEFGRMPGGQVSIVTRSGTNQLHGSIFEYFRNDALDATDYFVTRQNLAKPHEHQHDFGGVVGGPIQRDRTFVFFSYEGLRLDQPRSAVTEVPSLASRASASDAVRPFLAAFPVPNGPETANGLAQFSAIYADPSTLDATSVRVDRTFGSAVTVFGRYNYAPSDGESRLGSFAIASANTIGTLVNRLETVTGGATWIASPTISNELRVNWSSNVGTNYQVIDGFGGAALLPAATLHPAFAPSPNAYQINLGAANVLYADGLNADNEQRQVNIVDSFLVTKGSHYVKTGVDYRRLLPVYGPLRYVQAYTFSGVAGFLGGSTSAINLSTTAGTNRYPHATNVSVFAQDTWSASSRLTFVYGLRWEINPPPGLSATNEAITLTTTDPATMAIAAPGTAMYQTTYDNLAPRLGASYRLRDAANSETVVRGGWGVFYDLGSNAVMDNLANAFPFSRRRILASVPFPTDPALLTPPTITPGAPVDFLTAADPELKVPYTYQWNGTLEQALGSVRSVSIAYVGAVGRRLLRQERLINPNPRFQQVTLGKNSGHSRYDSLQVKYTQRMLMGAQALLSYTLASSKDNGSSDAIPVLPGFRVDPEQDWGPSDFDVRHALSGGVTYEIRALPAASVWHPFASGWSVDALFTARSALPVNVVTGTAAFGVSNVLRPDVVAGVPLYVDDASVPEGRRFNRSAFVNPPLAGGNPLRQGTLDRNALRGFGMSQVDLAVRKDIPIGGAMKVLLGIEVFNLFDQVNFGLPTSTLNSGLFGQPTRTLASSLGAGGVAGAGLSPLYQVGGPRSIQLACRFQF